MSAETCYRKSTNWSRPCMGSCNGTKETTGFERHKSSQHCQLSTICRNGVSQTTIPLNRPVIVTLCATTRKLSAFANSELSAERIGATGFEPATSGSQSRSKSRPRTSRSYLQRKHLLHIKAPSSRLQQLHILRVFSQIKSVSLTISLTQSGKLCC